MPVQRQPAIFMARQKARKTCRIINAIDNVNAIGNVNALGNVNAIGSATLPLAYLAYPLTGVA